MGNHYHSGGALEVLETTKSANLLVTAASLPEAIERVCQIRRRRHSFSRRHSETNEHAPLSACAMTPLTARNPAIVEPKRHGRVGAI